MGKLSHLGLFSCILISFSILLIFGCAKKEDESKLQITTKSEDAKADFLKGRDLFEKLKGQESLQYFESAYNKDKELAIAYYYHALSNPTAKGFFADLANAVKNAEKASEGERYIILSLQAGVNGDQKSAEDHLLKLIEKYPNDERAHSFLGQFYFTQQDNDKAVEHLKKSTEINPEFAPSYNMLGYSYKNMNNLSEAEKAFKKYIEIIPNDPNPYDSYAELLMKEGKYDESITQYKKALAADPNFFQSHIGIATDYNYMNKHEDARKELQAALTQARNDGEKRAVFFATAVSYVDEGKYVKAMEEIQKQYNLAKQSDDAANMSGDLNVMGDLFFEMGKYDEAMKKYDESLQAALNSDLSTEVKETVKRLALYNSARIQLMKNNVDAAKKSSKEFSDKAAKANDTFQIWLSHELEGIIALKEKDYNRAESELKLASQQNPLTFYYLGLAYQGLKDEVKSKNSFNTAAKFNSLNNMNQSFVKQKVSKKAAV